VKTYTLKSVKSTMTHHGDVVGAVKAAVAMDRDLQPAYGVTVELDGLVVASVDGRKLTYRAAVQEIDDPGHDILLTGVRHSDMDEDELIAEAIDEARRGRIDLTEDDVVVVEWVTDLVFDPHGNACLND
jgi:hypothetical protein